MTTPLNAEKDSGYYALLHANGMSFADVLKLHKADVQAECPCPCTERSTTSIGLAVEGVSCSI
jgi:hypothetical protein